MPELTIHTHDPQTGQLANTADLVVVLRTDGSQTTLSKTTVSTGTYRVSFAAPYGFAEVIASSAANSDAAVIWRSGVLASTGLSLNTNLLAWFRNNGTDWSGNARHLSATGTPGTTTGLGGVAGAAMSFAGDSSAWGRAEAIIGTGAFTLNCWVWGLTVSEGSTFSAVSQQSSGVIPLRMTPTRMAGTGEWLIEIFDEIGEGVPDAIIDLAADATPFMLTITHDGTSVATFVNGVLQNVPAVSDRSNLTDLADFIIGGGSDGAFAVQHVGAWSRALSYGAVAIGQPAMPGSDIALLYADGEGFDPTARTMPEGDIAAIWNYETRTLTVSGSGADEVTLTFTKEGSIPIADADVWITSDAGGDNVVAGTSQTDSNGQVTFMLDDGNVYFSWLQKDGINSIQGEQFTAEAD